MFMYLFSGACVDSGLQNVENRQTMKTGGWNVDGAPDQDAKFATLCNKPDTFWGYDYGSAVGYVEATFIGSGKGTLDFGNCYSSGETKVFLNDVEIDKAGANEKSKVITFDYNCGDTLKLTEEPIGIIKVNSLKLAECTSECDENKNGRLYIELKYHFCCIH